MLYYTLPQPYEFAAMLLAGVVIGAITLSFTFLRRLMRAGFVISLACDVLMGLLWAIVACTALVVACRGRARFFHFLGMALGCALFLAAVSPLARAAGNALRKGARALGKTLWKSGFVRALLK